MPVAVTAASGAMRRLLVVDDEESLRHMLQVFLVRAGYEVISASGVQSALAEIDAAPFDCVICDVRMPELGGLDLLDELAKRDHTPTVVMMSAYGSNELALDAMRRGAYDYVSKPFAPDEMLLVLRKAEERERLRQENRALRQALEARDEKPTSHEMLCGMVGKSVSMQKVFRTLRKVADYKTTVLITGESGTGKELVARALHVLSSRKEGPFVAVNCGAIPENLLESELFGHLKGSFTGAVRDKRGLFQEASGGTLFLDEIGEMPLGLQVKILRAIQEEEVRPLGENSEVQIDVRVVAATIRDLVEEVKAGNFREDLYYRLNVLPLGLPPLRERPEDIPSLVEHFIERYRQKHVHTRDKLEGVAPDAMEILLRHSWPGNVRELENTIERATVLCEGDLIDASLLEDRVRGPAPGSVADVATTEELSIKKTTRLIEEQLIRRALKQTGGNRTNAAKILEISHRALLYKIKEYGVNA